MTTHTLQTRRPPAPVPPPGSLGPIALYRALRANAITAWRAEAYEDSYIVGRNRLGGFVLLNDPDLIRYVLIDNAANYPKDDLQLIYAEQLLRGEKTDAAFPPNPDKAVLNQ